MFNIFNNSCKIFVFMSILLWEGEVVIKVKKDIVVLINLKDIVFFVIRWLFRCWKNVINMLWFILVLIDVMIFFILVW